VSVWRYTAVQRASGERRRGEISGACVAEARAALRRIDLQVVEIRALEPVRRQGLDASGSALPQPIGAWRVTWHRVLRGRRRLRRADLLDGLATMLRSGIPIDDALRTFVDSPALGRAAHAMLVRMHADLREGASLARAMQAHPAWFDAAATAMISAAEHSGRLPDVLASIAESHEHADDTMQRLAGALVYPCIVIAAGLVVTAFIGTRSLPQLAGILEQADVPVPRLTKVVMALGGAIAHHLPLIVLGTLACGAVTIAITTGLSRAFAGRRRPRLLVRPALLRRLAVGELSIRLAEMLRAGVPLVDALPALAPATCGGLSRLLVTAARRIQQGDDLVQSLADDRWFPAEHRRLLAVGGRSGELPAVLDRLGHRALRQSRRQVDRVVALLEPVIMVVLSALVGTVVMAAVLPLLRLQEIV